MYDESFWNKRYANRDYLYGTEPNSFLAEHCHLLRGPVLSLSEGEGRNGFLIQSPCRLVANAGGLEVSLFHLEAPDR